MKFILTALAYENNIEAIFLEIFLIKDKRSWQMCFIRSSDVFVTKDPSGNIL